MLELILNTIRDTIQKAKEGIILEVLKNTSRDSAEIRCDLLEIKVLLKKLYLKGVYSPPVRIIEPGGVAVNSTIRARIKR